MLPSNIFPYPLLPLIPPWWGTVHSISTLVEHWVSASLCNRVKSIDVRAFSTSLDPFALDGPAGERGGGDGLSSNRLHNNLAHRHCGIQVFVSVINSMPLSRTRISLCSRMPVISSKTRTSKIFMGKSCQVFYLSSNELNAQAGKWMVRAWQKFYEKFSR